MSISPLKPFRVQAISCPLLLRALRSAWMQYSGEFGLLLCCVMATIAPFLEQDYPINHSVHFNLSWAFQYQRQFFAGEWYPRWLEYSNFGFGNATFVFYPPLSLVATLPFAAIHSSVSGSVVGSMILALCFFAMGFYQYAQCFFRRSESLVLTFLALINPYLCIDLYQRGAIAEVWAIVCIPWILWFTHQRMTDDRRGGWTGQRIGGVITLAISYSLLILSHLPTLLLFTLVWWMLPGLTPRDRRKQVVLECYGAVILALGLSSLYLLPATLDQSLVQLQNLFPDPEYYPQNRLLVTGLSHLLPKVSTHWFDQTLVPYFLALLVVFIFGAFAGYAQSIALPFGKPWEEEHSPLDRAALWWCVTVLVAIVMMTDLGRIFYHIPLLEKIQFSWRWCAVTVVPLPLILGYFYHAFVHQVKFNFVAFRSRFSRIFIRGLNQALILGCVSLIGLNLFLQSNHIMDKTVFEAGKIETFNRLSAAKHFPQEPHIFPKEPFLNWHVLFQDGLGLGDVYEYRARPVKISLPPDAPVPLAQWSSPPIPSQAPPQAGSIDINTWRYGFRSLSVNNPSPDVQPLKLRMLYYPAWQVRLDQEPWQTVSPSAEGLAELSIPPGHHEAIVAYRGTAAEQWGGAFTLLSILVAAGFRLGGPWIWGKGKDFTDENS